MIRCIAFGHTQRARDDVGLQPAIGVGKKNPVTRGRARADVAGVTFAKPTFWQYVHTLHFQPGIFPGQSLENLARAIRGSIVHNDDFKFHSTLREQVMNGLPNPRFLIPCGDDYGTTDWSYYFLQRLQRRQSSHPAQIQQHANGHGEKQRGHGVEDESRPNGLNAADDD